MSSEDPMLEILVKPKNYYEINFDNIKTWEDVSFIIKAILGGTRISDVSPHFEELKERGFILDAK